MIELSSSEVIGGSFRLGFASSWTPFIHVSTSALRLKGAVDALPNIRNVIVETLSSTITNTTSWSITFQSISAIGRISSLMTPSSQAVNLLLLSEN